MDGIVVSLQLVNDMLREEIMNLNRQIHLTESYLENANDKIKLLNASIDKLEKELSNSEEKLKTTSEELKRYQEGGIYSRISSYIFG